MRFGNTTATETQQRAGRPNRTVVNLAEIDMQIARCKKRENMAMLVAFLVAAVVAGIFYWGFDMRKRLVWALSGPGAGWGVYTLLGGPEAEKRRKTLEKERKAKCKWL